LGGASRCGHHQRNQPQALTVNEYGQWLQRLATDEKALRHDLVDLTGFVIATGVRVGPDLLLRWAAWGSNPEPKD
jgi:hypothetical protein